MPDKNDGSFFWVGRYLSLALTLPAAVAAGYLMGRVAEHFLHWPILVFFGILAGMGAGITQVIKELNRDEKRSR